MRAKTVATGCDQLPIGAHGEEGYGSARRGWGYDAPMRPYEEKTRETIARWLGKRMGGPPVRFERVRPGEEQILEERWQRDLDSVPSALDPKNGDG